MKKIFSVLIFTITLSVFSMLPPDVYKALQNQAEESLNIEVVSVHTDTVIESTPVEYIKTIAVTATAIITEVERTANKLSVEDTITIGYVWENPTSYIIDEISGDTIAVKKIGGGQAAVIEVGRKSVAFLNYTDSLSVFQPAAYYFSFNPVNDLSTNNIVSDNKFITKHNQNIDITVLPNGKVVNINANNNQKELAKGIYLQNGIKKLNLKK